jgi:hypothetical protein
LSICLEGIRQQTNGKNQYYSYKLPFHVRGFNLGIAKIVENTTIPEIITMVYFGTTSPIPFR